MQKEMETQNAVPDDMNRIGASIIVEEVNDQDIGKLQGFRNPLLNQDDPNQSPVPLCAVTEEGEEQYGMSEQQHGQGQAASVTKIQGIDLNSISSSHQNTEK